MPHRWHRRAVCCRVRPLPNSLPPDGHYEDRHPVPSRRPVPADGRPAWRDRRADRGRLPRRPLPDAPRRDGHGQDVQRQPRRPERGQADARHLAQQDARGPALRRAPLVLPEQRRRVLHLVLRLLPARGVHRLLGHVHREGPRHQRGDRPAPAPRHVGARERAAGRDHRRVGVVHLRPRRPEGVQGADRAGQPRHRHPSRRAAAEARQHLLYPERHRIRARHVPRARRRRRDLPGVPRRHRLPHLDVGRRGRVRRHVRSADGAGEGEGEPAHDLPGEALRHAEGPDRPIDREHRRGVAVAARRAPQRGQHDRGAAAGAADRLRHRDDQGDRLLLGDRELLAPHGRPRARHAPVLPARLLPAERRRRLDDGDRREPRHRSRRCAGCTTATAPAS